MKKVMLKKEALDILKTLNDKQLEAVRVYLKRSTYCDVFMRMDRLAECKGCRMIGLCRHVMEKGKL